MNFDEFKLMLAGYDHPLQVRIGRRRPKDDDEDSIREHGRPQPLCFSISTALLRNVCKKFDTHINDTRREYHTTHAGMPDDLRPTLEICFEDDDPRAFEILIYWVYQGSISQDPEPLSQLSKYERDYSPDYYRDLIHAWILGDKYGLSDFQNHVMLELLQRSRTGDMSLKLADEAFRMTAPSSPMHRLVAMELAYLGFVEKSLHNGQIDQLCVREGVEDEVQRAYALWKTHGKDMFDRLPSSENSSNKGWKEYMVGGKGPKVHWIYEDPESHWKDVEGQVEGEA